jgi:hypothetical protein
MVMDIHIGFFRAKAVGEYFDLKRTYKDIRYWLIGEGYCDSNTTNFPERYFYLSETQKDGKIFYVWWRPKKALGIFSGPLSGGKGVEFYKGLKINMVGLKFKDAEIMHQGKKIKVQKGTFEIIVHATLHFGMPSWEKGSSFERGLFDLFWKRIYKKSIETYKKEALNDMYKFQAHLKKIMDMETWRPEGKTFEPHFGLPETEF